VKEVAVSLKDYHVDFAFLHVAQDHDTVLFDSDNPGRNLSPQEWLEEWM